MERLYEVKNYETHIEFLELLARKAGRLLKGGEPDVDAVAKMVLNDFVRGKLPWFTPPPVPPSRLVGEGVAEGKGEKKAEKGEKSTEGPKKRKETS